MSDSLIRSRRRLMTARHQIPRSKAWVFPERPLSGFASAAVVHLDAPRPLHFRVTGGAYEGVAVAKRSTTTVSLYTATELPDRPDFVYESADEAALARARFLSKTRHNNNNNKHPPYKKPAMDLSEYMIRLDRVRLLEQLSNLIVRLSFEIRRGRKYESLRLLETIQMALRRF